MHGTKSPMTLLRLLFGLLIAFSALASCGETPAARCGSVNQQCCSNSRCTGATLVCDAANVCVSSGLSCGMVGMPCCTATGTSQCINTTLECRADNCALRSVDSAVTDTARDTSTNTETGRDAPAVNCADFSACNTCAQNNCAWCTRNGSASCVARTDATGCSPSVTNAAQCSAGTCGSHATCDNCAGDTALSCVWCRTSSTCLAANAASSCNSRAAFPDECACPTYPACGSCANQQNCLWCQTTNSCENAATSTCSDSVITPLSCP